jgi:hypothetical protein
VKQDNSRLRI